MKELRRAYELKFQAEYKTKLNKPWEIKGMTKSFNVFFEIYQPEMTIPLFNFILWHRVNVHVWRYKKYHYFKFAYSSNYNHGHNVLRLFDIWPNFPFTISEMKRKVLVIKMVYTICRTSCRTA